MTTILNQHYQNLTVPSARNTRYRLKNTRYTLSRVQHSRQHTRYMSPWDTFPQHSLETKHSAKWIFTKWFMNTRDNKTLSIYLVPSHGLDGNEGLCLVSPSVEEHSVKNVPSVFVLTLGLQKHLVQIYKIVPSVLC
jgi:hypothetical protein